MRLQGPLLAIGAFVVTLLVVYQLQVAEVVVVIEYYDDGGEAADQPFAVAPQAHEEGRLGSDSVWEGESESEVELWSSREAAEEEATEYGGETVGVWRRDDTLAMRGAVSYTRDDLERFSLPYGEEEEGEEALLARGSALLLARLEGGVETHLPTRLERCIGAEVVFVLRPADYGERELIKRALAADLSASGLLRVALECEAAGKQEGVHHTSPDVSFAREVAVRLRQRDEGQFIQRFGAQGGVAAGGRPPAARRRLLPRRQHRPVHCARQQQRRGRNLSRGGCDGV